jgi:hypothetical protein
MINFIKKGQTPTQVFKDQVGSPDESKATILDGVFPYTTLLTKPIYALNTSSILHNKMDIHIHTHALLITH